MVARCPLGGCDGCLGSLGCVFYRRLCNVTERSRGGVCDQYAGHGTTSCFFFTSTAFGYNADTEGSGGSIDGGHYDTFSGWRTNSFGHKHPHYSYLHGANEWSHGEFAIQHGPKELDYPGK